MRNTFNRWESFWRCGSADFYDKNQSYFIHNPFPIHPEPIFEVCLCIFPFIFTASFPDLSWSSILRKFLEKKSNLPFWRFCECWQKVHIIIPPTSAYSSPINTQSSCNNGNPGIACSHCLEWCDSLLILTGGRIFLLCLMR